MLPTVRIVTPYSRDANNGNWRTASRWMRLLQGRFRAIVQVGAQGLADSTPPPDALIALHARRSHEAILRWHERYPERPLVVVLTGTDLYRDLPDDSSARASLAVADRLIVLQDTGAEALPVAHRAKTRVVYQSARTLVPKTKAHDRLDCVFVGHLREEKDPETAWAAWTHLPADLRIRLGVIGGALDQPLARALRRFQRGEPRVRWLGECPHAWTRQAIKRAHLLLISSRMEGGANVIVEAVTAGTPVLASRIPGNLGMLGSDYGGYFPVGNDAALAQLLWCCLEQPRFHLRLARQCAARRRLFRPEHERRALVAVLNELL